jgi:hypothetical protein
MELKDETHKNYSAPEYQPLIPLPEFMRSGRAPVEMHHLILFNKESLEKEGVIVRYGNRWLVSEPELYRWLRIYGKDAGRMI